VFPEDLIERAQNGGNHRPAAPVPPPVDSSLRFRLEDLAHDDHEPPPPRRLWLHILLFLVTFFTTTLVGAHMMFNFRHDLPLFEMEQLSDVITVGLRSPSAFFDGLPFSLTLLIILTAHEMGHYIACVWYGVDATLPFFLPSPVPGTGTFGAFIRIRSHIPTKRALFDIGVAGPLAGFVFLTPALLIGLAFSRVLPGIGHRGAWQLGTPALQWIAEKLIFPGVRPSDIYLHPMARAAWVGMLATAINLIPAGQLDGGHIVYSTFGRAHKWITWIFIAALLPMGWFYWYGWLLWAVMLFFFARRHPAVYDPDDIGAGRIRVGALALIVFILCFTLAPVNN
jgi:membrane-associated protease RseP (regulator of RpoE activity)